MSERDSRHRASYDDDGNIVLPETEGTFVEFSAPVQEETVVSFLDDAGWEMCDENAEPEGASLQTVSIFQELNRGRQSARIAIQSIAETAVEGVAGVVNEGVRQYTTSFKAGAPMLREAGDGLGGVFKRFLQSLSQPVWVRSGKKHVKQYSRGTLFVVDVVRFGGTFAAIFGMLFVAMNYQSFTEIAGAQFDVLINHPSLDVEQQVAETTLVGALQVSAAQEEHARDRGDLFSYLPTVGPPDNRVFIPKLDLNIPLVQPPVESLLRQDWTQVEADIQTALEQGVVHYPGTARPGQAGNFFVTGHSSYYPWAAGHYKTVFARLHQLEVGDEYWVYFNGDRHRYIVQSKKEVQPSDTTVLDQPDDKRISTLMTCTPVGTTLRRLVVSAVEVDPLTGLELRVGERTEKQVVPKLQLEALPI